jgi:hypothetical protein
MYMHAGSRQERETDHRHLRRLVNQPSYPIRKGFLPGPPSSVARICVAPLTGKTRERKPQVDSVTVLLLDPPASHSQAKLVVDGTARASWGTRKKKCRMAKVACAGRVGVFVRVERMP